MLNKLKQKMESLARSTEEISVEFLIDKVSPEIQKERFSICESCEFLYKPTANCKKCGCFMRIKTWMPRQRCPIKKWGPVEPEIKTGD